MDTKITSGYLLKLVSRSFALAIPLLDKNKRLAVETQYLLARVIDTIEDSPLSMDDKDTLIGAFNNILLTTDTEKLLAIKNIVHENTTSENDKMLVDNVQLVLDNFFTLDSKIQNISTTYLKEMGYGMLYYQDHDVETFEDLDDYCYYVAGTVGLYLTELVEIVDERELSRDYSKSFARFLQKVNIIRDAKEDLKENRIFWPKEIIGEFKIEDLFENPDYENQALLILDNMINNALAEFEQTIY
jgi:farnesyl-diphosphate farnesyltransferase